MWYFLRKLGTRPGTWTFLALAAIGIAMLVPAAATGLVIIAAAVMLAGLAISLPFYIWGGLKRSSKDGGPCGNNVGGYDIKNEKVIPYFFKNHPAQAIALTVGLAFFVTTMVLVIGGLTGVFPFMLPLLAAVAAPFTAAAMAGGFSLAVPVLVGFTLILASLNLTNVLKSVLAWFDSFKYDKAAMDPAERRVGQDWIGTSRQETGEIALEVNKPIPKYFDNVIGGIAATILPGPGKPAFTSPDAVRIEGINPTVKLGFTRI